MQILELAAQLQGLGLSDKEAKVYVAALFLGASPVQKIAEQADVNRATAYVILEQLQEMGLISQSREGKKTVFIAEPPESFEGLFDRQRDQIEERRSHLKNILPTLHLAERSPQSDAPMVRFYRGTEGIASSGSYLRRTARPGSTLYSMSNFDEVVKAAPEVMKSNPSQRLKKKIQSKLIYSYKSDIPTDAKLLRETYRLQEPVKADISLYEDKASFANYEGSDGETAGIVIESPEVVGALRQLFELAWNNQQK
jgi:sugar-specific transcriptional regulator TrmB